MLHLVPLPFPKLPAGSKDFTTTFGRVQAICFGGRQIAG